MPPLGTCALRALVSRHYSSKHCRRQHGPRHRHAQLAGVEEGRAGPGVQTAPPMLTLLFVRPAVLFITREGHAITDKLSTCVFLMEEGTQTPVSGARVRCTTCHACGWTEWR